MPQSDYILKYRGRELPVSMPEPGAACEHHGGAYSFGLPARSLAIAEEMAGHTARVLTPEGKPLAQLKVKHVDAELFVLSGDLIPDKPDGKDVGRLRRWLHGIFERWTVTRWPTRRAPPLAG
jgi:hypothetical protein